MLTVILAVDILTIFGVGIPKVVTFYAFFAKAKIEKLKANQNFRFATANFITIPVIMAIFYIVYLGILVTEIVFQ